VFLSQSFEFISPAHLFVFFLLTLFFIYLGWRIHHFWRVFSFWRQRHIGRRGELKAQKLLKRHGYKIVDSQLTLPGRIYVDNEPLDFHIRPDYLIEKNGIKYLAEIKTGEAASPINRITRRQLIEYASLTDADTIILVDATKGRIMKINFDQEDDLL